MKSNTKKTRGNGLKWIGTKFFGDIKFTTYYVKTYINMKSTHRNSKITGQTYKCRNDNCELLVKVNKLDACIYKCNSCTCIDNNKEKYLDKYPCEKEKDDLDKKILNGYPSVYIENMKNNNQELPLYKKTPKSANINNGSKYTLKKISIHDYTENELTVANIMTRN